MNETGGKHRPKQTEEDFGKELGLEALAKHRRLKVSHGGKNEAEEQRSKEAAEHSQPLMRSQLVLVELHAGEQQHSERG